jgi:hypothetical protein
VWLIKEGGGDEDEVWLIKEGGGDEDEVWLIEEGVNVQSKHIYIYFFIMSLYHSKIDIL